jgi:hypothetical protein
VAGGAQRGHVGRPEILHLVDEQGDAGAHVGGQRGGVGEQLHQVDLDVAGVGPPARRRHVDPRRPAVPQLRAGVVGAQGERLEHGQHLVDPVRVAVVRGQLTDGHVQGCGHRAAQGLIGPGLDLAGAPQPADRGRAQCVEQDGLADAAEAGEDEAALGTAAGHPLQHHVEGVQLTVAAGQLGRPLTCAGSVRVPHRVHG